MAQGRTTTTGAGTTHGTGARSGDTSALAIAGVAPDEERLYRLLVTVGTSDVPHLADVLGDPADQVAGALRRLVQHGLAASHGDPPRYTATAPDVALAPRVLSTQTALHHATSAIAELAEEHRASTRRRHADQLVEVVTGQAALRQALRSLQLSTRSEILWFCRAGHVAMPSADNDEEFAMLARGVRYRVVYEQALLEEPGMIDSLVLGVQAGEEARAAPSLPVRLAVADGAVALLPLVPARDGVTEPTAALVRDSNLLTALIALFESYWADASPLLVGHAGDEGDHPLTVRSPAAPLGADERRLLSLLVAGVSDKAIATRLGLSTRTVQRRVSDLMALTGAQTRMQFAWHAAQRGWLTADGQPIP